MSVWSYKLQRYLHDDEAKVLLSLDECWEMGLKYYPVDDTIYCWMQQNELGDGSPSYPVKLFVPMRLLEDHVVEFGQRGLLESTALFKFKLTNIGREVLRDVLKNRELSVNGKATEEKQPC